MGVLRGARGFVREQQYVRGPRVANTWLPERGAEEAGASRASADAHGGEQSRRFPDARKPNRFTLKS